MPKIDYRKKYEEYLGHPLESDMHVHHIDHDKTNNEVSNLVAIPKSLHGKYHLYFSICNDITASMNKEYSEIPFITNIGKDLGNLKNIAGMHGFNSIEMIFAIQNLADKSIRAIQSNEEFKKLSIQFDKNHRILTECKSEILDRKKNQDNSITGLSLLSRCC